MAVLNFAPAPTAVPCADFLSIDASACKLFEYAPSGRLHGGGSRTHRLPFRIVAAINARLNAGLPHHNDRWQRVSERHYL